MLGRVAVVASLALVACSNAAEIKKLAAERRADIEAALAPYRDIPKVLDKTPPFPELVRLGAPTHPLRFDTQRNAIILHAEDLAHLGSPGPVPLRIEGANPSAGGWTLPSQLAHLLATGEHHCPQRPEELRDRAREHAAVRPRPRDPHRVVHTGPPHQRADVRAGAAARRRRPDLAARSQGAWRIPA